MGGKEGSGRDELWWNSTLIGRWPQRREPETGGSAGSSLAFAGRAGKGARTTFVSDPLSQSTDYDLLQAEVTTGWYQEYHPRSIDRSSFSRPLPPSLLLWAPTPSFLFHLSRVLPGGRGDSLLISHSAPHPSSAGPLWEDPWGRARAPAFDSEVAAANDRMMGCLRGGGALQ